jgi:hypothetical protein
MVRIKKSSAGCCEAVVNKHFSKRQIVQMVMTLMATLMGLLLLNGIRSRITSSNNSSPLRAAATPVVSSSDSSVKSPSITQPRNPLQKSLATIAYAVSITGCGRDPITDPAAVLAHSIHLHSIHGNGRYDYALYAIYHPNAVSCASTLAPLGYTLLERETPVQVSEIQGEFLRSKIEQNGCCGEKELIKLHAYTLDQHPVVVHLDLDTLVLQPLDALFDIMLHVPKSPLPPSFHHLQQAVMWPNEAATKQLLSSDGSPNNHGTINAFYTIDYNMARPQNKIKPVQGGFLVLRPDRAVYQEYVDIVKKGDYQPGTGWGGVVGTFYGAMTFQGIIPYYYNVLHPGQAVELNPCVYNQMAINPRTGKTINDVVSGDCRTGQAECEDCRSRP